jgi:2-haloacid dehalogenase
MTPNFSAEQPADGYRALSFDCYGTLIDWEAGIIDALQPWCAWRGLRLDEAVVLELFARHESVVEAAFPALRYPEVLGETLRRMAAELGHTATDDEAVEFGCSVPAWPAFADSAVTLRRLQRSFRLIILSNIDRTSFAGSARRLGVDFDLVITAEDVGSYKPNLRHFDAMFEQLPTLGLYRPDVLHVAQSLFHDHAPAQQLGLPSVWIDRRHDRRGAGATPPSDATAGQRFTSLAEFADAVCDD